MALRRVSKKKEPTKITISDKFKPQVDNALQFIDSLREDDTRSSYREIAEKDDPEYQIYKQSQYLLSVMFKLLGRDDLFKKIRTKHSPFDPDNDLTREGHKAGDRFCVLDELDEELPPFYLAGYEDAENNDEKALLAIYWLKRETSKTQWETLLDKLLRVLSIIKLVDEKTADKFNYQKKTMRLYDDLRSRLKSSGVLEMDKADSEKKLYSLFKVSLFGILASKVGDQETITRVRQNLVKWQSESNKNGGWKTDLTPNLTLIGLTNLETATLSILALAL